MESRGGNISRSFTPATGERTWALSGFHFHREPPPCADVIANLLNEQHQKETLSHWHGAFAGPAE